MNFAARLFLLGSVATSLCAAPRVAHAEDPAPHSAHQFASRPAAGTVAASVELKVEPVSNVGLHFFALQTNFPNGVSAHGGPQDTRGVTKANWGALSSNDNYAINASTPVAQRLAVLEKMQNAPVRTDEIAWSANVWYRLDVKRGRQITLPAGDYSVLDEPKVHVDHARKMYEWIFTMRRADNDALVHTKTLHVASSTISAWMYWTETGYGVTCDQKLRVHWRSPQVTSTDGTVSRPTTLKKSIRQSTCPLSATTDIAVETPERMGTVQTFGRPRAAGSKDGDLLYPLADDAPAAGQPPEQEQQAQAASAGEAPEGSVDSDTPSAGATSSGSPDGDLDDAATSESAGCSLSTTRPPPSLGWAPLLAAVALVARRTRQRRSS